MEDNKIEMELNNEEVMDDVDEDVVDTELEDDVDAESEPDIEPEDEENPFAAFLGVLLIGGAAVGLIALAKRKELREKRYERLKRKMEKEAAKRGECVTIAKIESEDENAVEAEDVESEEDNEN
jgi:hypothetical protein